MGRPAKNASGRKIRIMSKMDVMGNRAEGCIFEGVKKSPGGEDSQKVGNTGARQAGNVR
jgi:hypothetical protein